MIAKLKRLNKILTLSKRRIAVLEATNDANLKATVATIPEPFVGRSVKLGYAVGGLDISYHIFGQNQEAPEKSGVIDLTEEFVDALTDTALKEYRGMVVSAFLDSVVNKHLKDEGLVE